MRDRLRRLEQTIRRPEPSCLMAPWQPPEHMALAAIRDIRRHNEDARYRMPAFRLDDGISDVQVQAVADLHRWMAHWSVDRQAYMSAFHAAIAAGVLPSDTDPEWLLPPATEY